MLFLATLFYTASAQNFSLQADAAQPVNLTLAAGPVASGIPVRSGIPFPKGAVTSLTNLRLENGDGNQQIPAQYDALALWPDNSVKSVLLQFVSDIGPQKNFRLQYGAGITRAPVASGIAVTQASGNTTVDTGLIQYVINSKGLINALARDGNGNGQYEAGEQILGAGEFFMVNAFDGVEYKASQATDPLIVVEEQGPVRAVIRARGSLMDGNGKALIKYLVRYYAYRGSDKLDIEFTVIDDRPEANVEASVASLAFAAKSYGLRWNYLTDGAAQYRFGTDFGNAVGGTVSAEHYLLQNGAFIFDNGSSKGNTFNYSGVASGLRAPGWMTLDSGARHLALMVRDFWQQYPIELNVKNNTLSVALFAERALGGAAADTVRPVQSGTVYKRPNSFYFTRPGGAKTHQMRFAFGALQPTSTEVKQINDGFQRHRLELTADSAWYTASGVFGDINVGTSTTASKGYDAMLLRDIYIPSIERPSAQSVIRNDPADLGGDATMFGWRDYGDRLRAGWNNVVNDVRIPAFYNDTHVGSNGFLHEFVRTGEQRWFQLGEISTRHFADIDVSHGPRSGYWNTPAPWTAMGQQPAGEVHAINHNNEDHQVRNLHWGHAHVSGLSDLYLLTGDKRSLEVLTEIALWWKHVTPYFFKTPFDPSRFREAERDYGWPLYVMNEYVRVTGDADYHKTVNAQLVKYLIQWWQTPLNHIGYNPATNTMSNAVIGVNDASLGTGYWTMTRMDNSNGSDATGTNPWMAGPLLSNVIKFYEQDQLLAASGKGAGLPYATIEDMLFQCMNYVVKYGYDATNDWFVYSEMLRYYSGGHTLIDFNLAYLDRLYKQKLGAGQIAHPEWYDTQANWSVIAKKRYDELMNVRVGANTQAYGFYGYELVYPVDFFKIMAPDTLGAPMIGTASAGNRQALVGFSPPLSNGGSQISGYTVASSPAGGVDSQAGSTSLSHLVTGLTNGVSYTFTVTATNANGPGPASAPSNAVTPAPIRSYSGQTTNGASATLSFTGGGAGCSFTKAAFVSGLGPGAPAEPGFAQGLVDLRTADCTPGSTLVFTLVYSQALPPGTKLWKFGPTSTNAVPHWYRLPATILGNTMSFSIVDGGPGDDDLSANGVIAGIGGPALRSMNIVEWMMLLLD